MKARHINEIGVRWSLRRYWGEACLGASGRSYHNAEKHLFDEPGVQSTIGSRPAPGGAEWPTACDACGAACPEDAPKQMFPRRLYDTASGSPEPGRHLRSHWIHDAGRGVCEWDGCDGKGRASNCTKPQDRAHRCWVLHGDPVHTASKAGNTCAAGAGSIVTPKWHGFLVNGEWRSC